MIAPEPFVLYPHHTKFAAGQAPYRGLATKGYIAIVIIALAIGLTINFLVSIFVMNSWEQWYQLEQTGVATQATVVSWRRDRINDRTRYYMTYRFAYISPDGEPRYQTAEASTDWATYWRLEQGMAIPIYYVPTNPRISRLASDMHPPIASSIGIGIVVLGIDAGLLFVVLWSTYRWWRDRRLARNGRLLAGKIQRCTYNLRKHRNLGVTIEYSFQAPTGQVMQAKARTYRNDLQGQPLPETGTPVWVLYADEGAYRVL